MKTEDHREGVKAMEAGFRIQSDRKRHWEVHKVIQAVMDWQDDHLHQFTVGGRAYGVPDPEEEHQVLDEQTVQLQNLGLSIGDRVGYVYDFGDNWQHVLELKNRLPPAAKAVYPVCVGGEFAASAQLRHQVRSFLLGLFVFVPLVRGIPAEILTELGRAPRA